MPRFADNMDKSIKKKGSSTEMGMAASQARFLGLTARKNNVEFEGQQINQQRTALSNQSANYYNDLLGMAVPVPPSVDDYTKTVYTFEDGALTNQITAMIAQPDGNYTISFLRQWTDDFSVVAANTSIVNRSQDSVTGGYIYRVGSKTLRQLSTYETKEVKLSDDEKNDIQYMYVESGTVYSATKDGSGIKVYNDDGSLKMENLDEERNAYDDTTKTGIVMYLDPDILVDKVSSGDYVKYVPNVDGDEYLKTLSEDQLMKLLAEEEEYTALLKAKYGDNSEYLVRYIKNTTTEEWEPYFYKENDLENAIYDDPATGNSLSNIRCYKIGSETKTEEVKALPECLVEKDSSGRYINITIPQFDESGNRVSGGDITYALTTSTVTDQGAYEDAMNQYEYEKYQYDQAIQEINAKIEIIQAEDKNLELRLKQLDTEQKAISTEIDAVGQVIQKNTESSFKTFG